MKKQLIEFKQKEYNEKVNDLNKVIDTVNESIPILVSNGIEPTFEVIKELFTNKKKFIQDRFIEETNKISDIVGITIEYVIQNGIGSTEWIITGARNKVKYLYEIKSLSNFYNWCFSQKYFIIEDGIAKLTSNYLDIIKEDCSIYTDTTNQNDSLQSVKEIVKQYNSLGENLNNKHFKPVFIYYEDGEYKINGEKFKQIF